jgi:Kazal-type serine protease inhibitor domain
LTRYDLITVVDFEHCSSKADTCSKMVCPYDKEEVCGTDGVSYANQCHLSRVTCTSGFDKHFFMTVRFPIAIKQAKVVYP